MRYYGYVLETEDLPYVGITNPVRRRLREHRAKGPLKGRHFTLKEELEFTDRGEAAFWEIEKIAELGGPDFLLNTSLGGYGGRRRVVTDSERAHLSKLATDRQRTPEFRQRMSEACKAAWANPKLRKEMSERTKASCQNEDTKKARSEAQKKLWSNPEVRARRIAGIKKDRNDPQKAKARSEAAKRMWETRRKNSA